MTLDSIRNSCDVLIKFQGEERCNLEGWDCIEENAKKNFSCSVNCKGIYADVQVVKERLTKILTKRDRNFEHTTVENNVLDGVEKAANGVKEQEEDNEKVSRLVKQYHVFKKENLPNFFFNPEKGTEQYSKCQTF